VAGPWERYGKTSKPVESPVASSGPWKKYQAKPDDSEPTTTESFAQGAFTTLVGQPVDLINEGLLAAGRATGLPLGTEEPFLGTKHLESFQHGYNDPSKIPERHRFAAGAGETVGASILPMLVPYGLPAKGAQVATTTGTVEALAHLQPKGVISAMAQYARNNPTKYLSTEAFFTFLSSLGGGAAAKLAPGDPTARLIGEVGVPILTPGTFLLRASGLLKHQFRNIKAKVSTSGKTDAVAEALQNDMKLFDDDVQKAIKNLESKSLIDGENLLAGEKSGSPVILAIQQRYLRENPLLDKKHQRAIAETLVAYRLAARKALETGDTEAFRQAGFLQQKLLLDMLANDVATVTRQAEAAAARIRPRKDPETLSTANTNILENAYSTGRQGEAAVWGEIPNDELVTSIDQVQPILDRYEAILDVIPEDLIPPYMQRMKARIERLSGQLGEGTEVTIIRDGVPSSRPTPEEEITTGDLKLLRTQLLRLARATRDSPKDISYAMNELADSILDSFGNLGLGTVVDDARAFSYQFNQLFTKGKVGELLGYTRKGGRKVEPGMTLEKTLGPGGTGAAISGKKVERAAQLQGLPPQGRGQPLTGQAVSRSSLERRTTAVEQEDFIKNLADTKDIDGRINPTKLENFVKSNAELLKRFPRLRGELKDAASTERLLQRLEKKQLDETRMFESKSIFSRLMNSEDSSLVVGDVLRGRTPIEGYASLINAAKAHSPEAVDGLRIATFDWIFNNSMKGDMLSPEQIGKLLNYKPSQKSASVRELMESQGVLTKTQSKNLDTVLDRMAHTEEAMQRHGDISLVLDDINMLEDVLARLIGSNLAGSSMLAKNTGSSLLLAHAGSKWAQKIMNQLPIEATHKIVIDALEDTTGRKLANLLRRDVSSKTQRELEQQLEAWLWSAGTRYMAEEEKKPGPRPTSTRVYHTGGMVHDFSKLSANLDKIPDLQREKHLRAMHEKDPKTFNRLLEYLESR
jgi:hypothetical protein